MLQPLNGTFEEVNTFRENVVPNVGLTPLDFHCLQDFFHHKSSVKFFTPSNRCFLYFSGLSSYMSQEDWPKIRYSAIAKGRKKSCKQMHFCKLPLSLLGGGGEIFSSFILEVSSQTLTSNYCQCHKDTMEDMKTSAIGRKKRIYNKLAEVSSATRKKQRSLDGSIQEEIVGSGRLMGKVVNFF